MNEQEIAVKKKQNEKEIEEFQNNLHKLIQGDKKMASKPLIIGKTPNVIAICGADETMDLTIKKSVIDKCLRPEIRDENNRLIGKTGHGLTTQHLIYALDNIKKPLMVFKGSHENSLIVVTDIKDTINRKIIVAIELNQKEGFQEVNKVTSTYGRNNFGSYFNRQVLNGNLLAINTEKVDDLLHSIEKKYLKENAIINFDDSIAYTLANVNI